MPLILKVSFGLAELISAVLVYQEMSGFFGGVKFGGCQQMSTFLGDAKIRTNKQVKALINNSFIGINRCYKRVKQGENDYIM